MTDLSQFLQIGYDLPVHLGDVWVVNRRLIYFTKDDLMDGLERWAVHEILLGFLHPPRQFHKLHDHDLSPSITKITRTLIVSLLSKNEWSIPS